MPEQTEWVARASTRLPMSLPGSSAIDRRSLLGSTVASIAAGVTHSKGGDSDPDLFFGGRRIDVRDFGARGDRKHNDGPAITAAINAAAQHDQYPTSVFLAAGHYYRRDPIVLPNFLSLVGEGASSVLNSQGDSGFDRPVLTNAAPAGLIHVQLTDLTLLGGSHGLKLHAEAENADIRLTNIDMELQSTANIEANLLFQTSKLLNCSFARAPYGLKVDGYGTNLLVCMSCEWTEHSESAVYLRGVAAATFIGNRFENGGLKGKVSIDIDGGDTILFIGCWFENSHEFLARFRNITGQVVFQSCHFTGTKLENINWRGFRWDIGDCRITFRDCISVTPMVVDGHIGLDGSVGISSSKATIQGSDRAGSLTAIPYPVPDSTTPLLSIMQSGSETWSIVGRLILLLLDQHGGILLRKQSDDVVLQPRSNRQGLLDTDGLSVIAEPTGKEAINIKAAISTSPEGSKLWWRFTWEAINGAVTVRAS